MVTVLAAVMILFASCGNDEAEVIPRKKMARIYAEMLVTDQWITATPGVRMIADTSLVYEPILEKYGYDSEDYRKSVDVYMDDPERFARIFRTTGELIDIRLKEVEKQQAILDAIAKLPRVESDFKVEDYVPYWGDEPYVHYYDSLDVVYDSLKMYRLVSIERGDTLYDRIRMIRPALDSLANADSLKIDSLKVDSLKVDSLMIAPLKKEAPAKKVPKKEAPKKEVSRKDPPKNSYKMDTSKIKRFRSTADSTKSAAFKKLDIE